MKTKIKQLVCMTIAFVASFMVSVTAFASTIPTASTNSTFPFYVGSYIKQNGSGHITLNSDDDFSLTIYRDDTKNCYVSGRNGQGIIGIGARAFDVSFDSVTKCNADGTPPATPGKILGYEAVGKVAITNFKKTIYPLQSDEVFVKQ